MFGKAVYNSVSVLICICGVMATPKSVLTSPPQKVSSLRCGTFRVPRTRYFLGTPFELNYTLCFASLTVVCAQKFRGLFERNYTCFRGFWRVALSVMFLIVGTGFGSELWAEGKAKTLSLSEYRQFKQANRAYQDADYEAAVMAYSKALSQTEFPGEVEANLGSVFYQQGAFDKAVELYESAVAQLDESKQAAVFYNLGNAYVQLKQKQPAIEAYKRALDLNPDDVDTKYNLEVALQLPDPESDPNQPPPTPQSQTPPPPPNPNTAPPPMDQKKMDAQQLLNLLEQLEQQARKQYRNQPPDKEWVEFDW